MNIKLLGLLAGLALAGPPLHATGLNGNAYGANDGWVSAHSSAAVRLTSAGVRVLSGYLCSANCGWINLGNDAPGNGTQYANTTGSDFGVNRLVDGSLRGLAWSANLGWINFEATGNPQLDIGTGQLSGYAWCANAGWLRLDGLSMATVPLAPNPLADSFSRALNSDLKLTPAKLLENDSDPKGASLTLVSVQDSLPAGAAVTLSEGWIFYTVPAGFSGTGSFTYTVMNPDTLTATTTVTVDVAANPYQESGNRLAFEVQAGGVIYLKYAGIRGRSYFIQATETLISPVIWTTLGSKVAGPNGVFDWLDVDAPMHPLRYYRTDAPANP